MTKAQYDAFKFIRAYIAEHGHSPCVREVAEGTGQKSKSGAHRVISALRRDGYLVRAHYGSSRSMELSEARGLSLASIPSGELVAELNRRLAA